MFSPKKKTENLSSLNRSINLSVWLLIGNCSWWQNGSSKLNVNEFLNGFYFLGKIKKQTLWLPLQIYLYHWESYGINAKIIFTIIYFLLGPFTAQFLKYFTVIYSRFYFGEKRDFGFSFFRRLNENCLLLLGNFLFFSCYDVYFVFVCLYDRGTEVGVWCDWEGHFEIKQSTNHWTRFINIFSNCGIDWQIIWLSMNEGGLTRDILEVVFT